MIVCGLFASGLLVGFWVLLAVLSLGGWVWCLGLTVMILRLLFSGFWLGC